MKVPQTQYKISYCGYVQGFSVNLTCYEDFSEVHRSNTCRRYFVHRYTHTHGHHNNPCPANLLRTLISCRRIYFTKLYQRYKTFGGAYRIQDVADCRRASSKLIRMAKKFIIYRFCFLRSRANQYKGTRTG